MEIFKIHLSLPIKTRFLFDMPTAILKFNLPEEQEEFKHAQDGIYYSIAFENLYQNFRKEHKYHDKDSWTYEEILNVISASKEEAGLK